MSYRIVSYAEVLPWTMSTDFGADSSSHFPSRARTDRQTDATERPTHAGGYVAGVGDIGPSFGKFTAINARGSSCLASSVNKPGDRLQAWLLAAAGIFFWSAARPRSDFRGVRIPIMAFRDGGFHGSSLIFEQS